MKKLVNKKTFLRLNAITLGSVFVLILVGSIVRVMGAGMGCPDWPKCFGAYIPPTSEEGLPINYNDIYRDQRIAKNKRLAATLQTLGYQDLALKITNDPTVLTEHPFDARKAWIEYVNRLVGVLIGFFVILNMIFSFSFRKENIRIPLVGVLIFILTCFQGWVGSLVVSTNLLHGFITFHMVLALLIVALLIWMNVKMRNLETASHKPLFLITLGTFLLFIPQILLGTEVRSIIDDLLVSTFSRSTWAQQLSGVFYIHRSYSWLILIGVLLLNVFARKTELAWLKKTTFQLTILVVLAILAGIIMVNFDFPFWIQPLHLIFAVGIFSLLFYLTLRVKYSN